MGHAPRCRASEARHPRGDARANGETRRDTELAQASCGAAATPSSFPKTRQCAQSASAPSSTTDAAGSVDEKGAHLARREGICDAHLLVRERTTSRAEKG